MGGSGRMVTERCGLFGEDRVAERGTCKDRQGKQYPTFSIYWTTTRDIPTTNGDCGSAYLTADRTLGNRRIFGIHSIGSTSDLFTRAAVVTREDLDLLVTNSCFQGLPTPLREAIDVVSFSNPLPGELAVKQVIRRSDLIGYGLDSLDTSKIFDLPPTERFQQLGYSSRAYRPSASKTKLAPSPFAGECSFERRTIPAYHNWRQVPEEARAKLTTREGVPSLIGSQIKHLATQQYKLDPDVLSKVKDHIVERFRDVFSDYTVLNDFEIKNGVKNPTRPHFGSVQQIDGTKSAGAFGILHRKLKKEDYLAKKFEDDKSYNYLWDNSTPHGTDLQQHFRLMESLAKGGFHLLDPIEARVKDELLPIEKAQTGKVRLFENVGLATFLLQRKYLGHFLSRAQEARLSIPWVTGFNPMEESTRLYMELKRISEVGEAGDFSRFDKTIPLQVQILAHEILCEWACAGQPDRRTEFENIFRVLCSQNTRELHLAEGIFYWTNGSFNSGCYATNFLDGMFNLICHYYNAHFILERPDAFQYLDANCAIFYNGDDVIRAITPELGEKFHFNSLREQYKKYGMEYTAPSKDGSNPPDLIPILDMDFSSRGFRLEGTLVFCPLKKISIERTLLWTTRGCIEDFKQVVSNSLVEAFQWGREYYTYVLQEIASCKRAYWLRTNTRFECPMRNYNAFLATYLSSVEFEDGTPVKGANLKGTNTEIVYQSSDIKEMSQCFDCTIVAVADESLIRHVINSHPNSTNIYHCHGVFCDKRGTPAELKQHRCPSSGSTRCTVCRGVFKSYHKAAQHHRSAHDGYRQALTAYWQSPHPSLVMLDGPAPTGTNGLKTTQEQDTNIHFNTQGFQSYSRSPSVSPLAFSDESFAESFTVMLNPRQYEEYQRFLIFQQVSEIQGKDHQSSPAPIGGSNDSFVARAPASGSNTTLGAIPVNATVIPEAVQHVAEGTPAPTMSVDIMGDASVVEYPSGIPNLMVYSGSENSFMAQAWRPQITATGNISSINSEGAVIGKFIYGTRQTIGPYMLEYTRAHSHFGGSVELSFTFSANSAVSGQVLVGFLPTAPGLDEDNVPTLQQLMAGGVYQILNLQGVASTKFRLNDIREDRFYRRTSEILDATDTLNNPELASRPRFYIMVFNSINTFTGASEIVVPYKVLSMPCTDPAFAWTVNNFVGFSGGTPSIKDLSFADIEADFGINSSIQNLAESVTGLQFNPRGYINYDNTDVTNATVGPYNDKAEKQLAIYSTYNAVKTYYAILFSGALPADFAFPWNLGTGVTSGTALKTVFDINAYVQSSAANSYAETNGTSDLTTWVPPAESMPSGWTFNYYNDTYPSADSATLLKSFGRVFRFINTVRGESGCIYIAKIDPNAAASTKSMIKLAALPGPPSGVVNKSTSLARNNLRYINFVCEGNAHAVNPIISVAQLPIEKGAFSYSAYIRGWLSAIFGPFNSGYANVTIKQADEVIGQMVIEGTPSQQTLQMLVNTSMNYGWTSCNPLSLSNPSRTTSSSVPNPIQAGAFQPAPSIGVSETIEKLLNERIAAFIDERQARDHQSSLSFLAGGALAGLGQGLGTYASYNMAHKNKLQYIALQQQFARDNNAALSRYQATMQSAAVGTQTVKPKSANMSTQTMKANKAPQPPAAPLPEPTNLDWAYTPAEQDESNV
jgi:hypothetical protein